MLLPNRHGSVDSYRYGFQGQEKDDEIKGEGNSINYKFRMHDPRVGRFFATDPLESKYSYYSPYQFSGNKVIQFVELEGLEEDSSTMLANYLRNWFISQKTSDNTEQQAAILADLNSKLHLSGIAIGGSATLAVGGGYGTVLAAEWALAYPMSFVYVSDQTAAFVWGLGTDEPYFNPTAVTDDLSSNIRRACAAGLGDDMKNAAVKALKELHKAINPTGSNMNCVNCAIQLQRYVAMGANDIAAKATDGAPTSLVGVMLKEAFGWENVYKHPSFKNSASELIDGLASVGQESVVIVGKLKTPNGKVTDHVFNAVRDSDFNWHVIDAQTGSIYNNEFLDKTFSYFTIFETIIDTAVDNVNKN